ncbi:MAG TPA: CAP domain-containing protein [Mycobacteriales bacterium]|jgi:uncharacterized protein YkwD|nr:CAP domain-containing protein [Mycobacteriales bacterium]
MAIRQAAVVAATMSVLSVVPVAAAGAQPASRAHFSSFDQRLLYDINHQRSLDDLASLTLSAPLQSLAVSWANQEAAEQRLYDNPHLRAAINQNCPSWKAVGEVAGRAGNADADALFKTYMNNPAEHQTLLSRSYTQVGLWSVAVNEDGSVVQYNAIDLARGC